MVWRWPGCGGNEPGIVISSYSRKPRRWSGLFVWGGLEPVDGKGVGPGPITDPASILLDADGSCPTQGAATFRFLGF